MMLRNSGLEKLAFGDALGAEPYRHRRSIAGGGTGGYRYVTFGLYMQHIKRMLEHFPRSQMHFMRTEDLNDDMPGQMRALYRFLDVDESFIPETTRLLEGHYTERMSDSDHAYLRAAHRKDTEELESFTGWDLSAWKLRRGAGTTAARAARS